MNTPINNRLRILIVLCAGFFLWIKSTMLSDAIHTVDNYPKETLALLENMSPESLYDNDKDQYMQYVVIWTQARYMNDQDITGDSLILDAQRYFAKTHNYEMAARASYYAAVYWYEGEASDKAMEYWQAAFSFAERAGNNLFMIKSAYGLGQSYYSQEQWENAMIYCQKTLELYDDKPGNEHYKLSIIDMLGYIYRERQDPEQAYRYFDDGLKAAKNLNNIKYESRFLRQIGHIYRDKGEYRQAKEYFDLALSKQPEQEDKLRIYLSYAKLHEDMNRPDSALYYLRLVEDRIPEITYPNTRRDLYAELAAYYESNGRSTHETAHYLQLAHMEDLRIKKSQIEKKIELINQRNEQLIQKKQKEVRTYRKMFNYAIISLLLLGSLLVIVEMKKRRQKNKYKETISRILSTQVVDQQHFLLTGLRGIAKSMDDMLEKKLAYAGSPVWEQLLALREEFSLRIAECISQDLERLHNGRKALPKLTLEDLSIIYLSQFEQRLFPDDYIGWMLGHQGNTEQYIMLRKGQIRRIMAETGMRDWDIKMLLP